MAQIRMTEDGQRLYSCLRCLDTGYVHPRLADGKPDYAHVKRCSCEVVLETQTDFPIDHAERPSRRKK